jgi:Flp pilus assembly pilin Flp
MKRNPTPRLPSLVLRDQSGQGLMEYLILVILIAGVAIAAAKTLGGTVKEKIALVERHVKKDIRIEEGKEGQKNGK